VDIGAQEFVDISAGEVEAVPAVGLGPGQDVAHPERIPLISDDVEIGQQRLDVCRVDVTALWGQSPGAAVPISIERLDAAFGTVPTRHAGSLARLPDAVERYSRSVRSMAAG
jgi:hypothetical protein